MDLESVIQIEVSQKEKSTRSSAWCSVMTYMGAGRGGGRSKREGI